MSFIKIKEKSLLERKEVLTMHGYDPRQKTYEEAYETTPELTTFDVFFREDCTQEIISHPGQSYPCTVSNMIDIELLLTNVLIGWVTRKRVIPMVKLAKPG